MLRWELQTALCPKNGGPKLIGQLNAMERLALEGRQSTKKVDLNKNQLNALIDEALRLRDFKWAKKLNERKQKLCSNS